MPTPAPYYDYSTFLARHFAGKVQKLSVDAGFTCPNRDGSVGRGGCAYCNNRSFRPDYCRELPTVTEQLEAGKRFFSRKYPHMRYLAYFQAYTNTYADLPRLRALYEEALAVPGVVGLVVSTRPDCVPDDVLDYVAALSRRTFVLMEYGVESVSDATLRRICRGHDFACAADAVRRTAQRLRRLGLVCNVGAECEFYLFETDERGRPTRTPIDHGGYFDVYPLDAGENIRRDICLTLEQMGLAPQHSHHESGCGQNEIDFHYASPLKTADHIMMFKQTARAIAGRSGLYASFMPKPLADQAGSGLHINISLYRDGHNLFEGDIAPDSAAGSFMAGVLAHSRELAAFTSPLPNSYLRLGCNEAPRFVSWSRQNRSQLVRIPAARGDSCRMELRSPDPACNPYLAIGLILAAGLDGVEQRLTLPAPVDRNLFALQEGEAAGLAPLPAGLEEAVAVAQASPFLHKVLPEERYYEEQLRRCAELRAAADPAEYERARWFGVL